MKLSDEKREQFFNNFLTFVNFFFKFLWENEIITLDEIELKLKVDVLEENN